MAIIRDLLRILRGLVLGHPLRRLRRGALRAFPYEIGYLRFVGLTRFGTWPDPVLRSTYCESWVDVALGE